MFDHPFIGILVILSLIIVLFWTGKYCKIQENRYLFTINDNNPDYKSEILSAKGVFFHSAFLVCTALAVIFAIGTLPLLLALFTILYGAVPSAP
jgi:hypothetical protein